MKEDAFPFDRYPEAEGKLLSVRRGLQSRRVDCAEHIRLTGIPSGVYCELDFKTQFENWLNNGVGPCRSKERLHADGVHREFHCRPGAWSYSNAVLSCSACIGFFNRFKESTPAVPLESASDFFALRKRIYAQRRDLILKRRLREKQWFDAWIESCQASPNVVA